MFWNRFRFIFGENLVVLVNKQRQTAEAALSCKASDLPSPQAKYRTWHEGNCYSAHILSEFKRLMIAGPIFMPNIIVNQLLSFVSLTSQFLQESKGLLRSSQRIRCICSADCTNFEQTLLTSRMQ
jgi:hypothetical protein